MVTSAARVLEGAVPPPRDRSEKPGHRQPDHRQPGHRQPDHRQPDHRQPGHRRHTRAKHLPPLAADPCLLSLPADLLFQLPVPVEMTLRAHDGAFTLVVGPTSGDAAAGAGVPFSPAEWDALCEGVSADRVFPGDLRRLCERKISDASFRVTRDVALAGAQPDVERPWSVRDTLARLDLQLLAVRYP